MTNKKNWLGVLVIVLTFGMTVVSCNANKIDGTWIFADDDIKIIFEKGKFQLFYGIETEDLEEEATGTIKGDTLVLIFEGEDEEENWKFSLNGNTLTVTTSWEETMTGTKVGKEKSAAKKNSKDSGKASAVVKRYYEALAKGDAKTIGEVMTAKGAQNLTPFMSKAKDYVTALGKITKIEEDIDGDTGVVTVRFSNGDTEEIEVIKVGGKWRISEWDRGMW
jgi:hypothetical protein